MKVNYIIVFWEESESEYVNHYLKDIIDCSERELNLNIYAQFYPK